ncbi:hypothetical protein LTR86_007769 [Recurvomyces mirabilis]|nr:hypothetical protein LTR86_007769 [Recurvomyces mirabilis]
MSAASGRLTIRDLGYSPGLLPVGPTNSILDVTGVHIGQVTLPTSNSLPAGSTATKGVTVICPRAPKQWYKPCRAGRFVFNGNGEVTGSGQVEDWGYVNTPIALTNSLSLGAVIDASWDWIMEQEDQAKFDLLDRSRHYGTPIVGETSDWIVNSDVRHSRLPRNDIQSAFNNLKNLDTGGFVHEGQYGGGAGMTCHHHAGGTGTASRLVGGGTDGDGQYTVGVLVQTNYGHLPSLSIGGVPVGRILQKEKAAKEGVEPGALEFDSRKRAADQTGRASDGSIVVIVITDAPLSSTQLRRLARHATSGLAQVGGHAIGSNFSGDIFLALSTAEYGPEQLLDGSSLRGTFKPIQTYPSETIKNESIDPFFIACAEATEEAILNSLVGGRPGTVGMDGSKIDGLPVKRVEELLRQYHVKV